MSLAVPDLAVGLLVQPFYIGLLIKWLQRDNSADATCTTFFVITIFFSATSFLGVVALSGDRFLALHLHLRYQELVTRKRVVVNCGNLNMGVQCIFLLIYLLVSTNIFFNVISILGVIFESSIYIFLYGKFDLYVCGRIDICKVRLIFG